MGDLVTYKDGSASSSSSRTREGAMEPSSMTHISDMGTQLALERLDHEVISLVRVEKETGRLSTDGRLRLTIRERMQGVLKLAHMQLSLENRTLLLNTFGLKLLHLEEYGFAIECLNDALALVDSIPEEVRRIRTRVETMQGLARALYMQYGEVKNCRLAPMSVSKILGCLKELRSSILLIFDLPTPQLQEESAWQILNGCKLIATVGQPLLWHYCGKYVYETFLLAAMCMESVINLCTARHISFRMKLYAGAFYAAMTQGTVDNATAIVAHVSQQLKELRLREELDPPIPVKIEARLVEAESDLAVMQCALNFWKDPDSFSLTEAALGALGFTTASEAAGKLIPEGGESCQSNGDRCFIECVRVQQQTAGNQNEPWRKRSTSLLKAFWAELEPMDMLFFVPDYVVNSSSASAESALSEKDAKPPVQPPKPVFSMHALLEAASLAMFDDVDTEVVPVAKVLIKIWGIVDAANASAALKDDSFNTQSFLQLKLLKDLAKVCEVCADKTTAVKKRVKASAGFISRLEGYVHSEVGHRTPAFGQRVAAKLWGACLFTDLQTNLSDEQPSYEGLKLRYGAAEQKEQLELFAPLLLAVARMFEVSESPDPVLAASMSLTAARLLAKVADYRAALSLLRRALLNVEEQRAARVDLRLHQPDDPRDLTALQRISLSTRADAQSWLHASKRLGAHAFAGYGIFGSSSAADREDQALADLHTDLTTSYFRIEVQFCVLQRRARAVFRQQAAKAAASPGGVPPTPAAGAAGAGAIGVREGTVGVSPGQGTAAFLTDAASGTISVDGAEALPCVHFLRAFCGKNLYTKSLLLMELARVEENEGQRVGYLNEARSCIEDAEAREQLLRDSFTDLTVMKDKERVFPLVLARSHRWIYVCPVGCQRLRDRRMDDDDDEGASSVVAYYRVLAKEQGAGTDVSLSSTGHAGCERKVPIGAMHSPTAAAVRISPLRNGERYLFASAGFNAQDKPIGTCSPTTPPVEAVNPLPTVLLWAYLSQTAAACGPTFGPLAKAAADRVCARFFLPSRPPQSGADRHPLTVGKGVNVFLLDEEPALCMLAIQQSSHVLLRHFILAFLLLESPSVPSTPPDPTEVHPPHFMVDLAIKKNKQVKLLTSFRRTAVAASIAVNIGGRELVVRLVSLGYELASELLVFDEQSLAQPLQAPLVTLTAALQTVPKLYWRALEHALYTRLLTHAIKTATATRNVAPVLSLLASFYPETVKDGPQQITSGSVMGTNVTPPLQAEYTALWATVRAASAGGLFTTPALEEQFAALLETPSAMLPTAPPARPESALPPPAKGKAPAPAAAAAPAASTVDFWKLSPSHRLILVRGVVPGMMGVEGERADRPGSATTSKTKAAIPTTPASPAPGGGGGVVPPAPPSTAAEVTGWMSKHPDCLSSLLTLLVKFAREIIAHQPRGPVVAKMLNTFVVNEKMVSALVLCNLAPWQVAFVREEKIDDRPATTDKGAKPAPPVKAPSAKAPPAAKGASAKPLTPAVVDEVPVDEGPVIDPYQRFWQVDADETSRQMVLLAELCVLLASSGGPGAMVRDHHPLSKDGPQQAIEPAALRRELCQHRAGLPALGEGKGPGESDGQGGGASEPYGADGHGNFVYLSDVLDGQEGGGEEGRQVSFALETPPAAAPVRGKVTDVVVDRSAYVRYMCAAISMFSVTGQPAACVDAAVHLWTYIVDQWVDPVAFAVEFHALVRPLQTAASSLVWALETAAGFEPGHSSPTTHCTHPAVVPEADADALHEARMGETTGGTAPGTADASVAPSVTPSAVHTATVTGTAASSAAGGSASALSVAFRPGAFRRDALGSLSALAVATPCPKRTLFEYLDASKAVLTYLLKVLWLLREYKQVVEVGSRTISMYMLVAPGEFSRGIGKHVMHLMVDGQEQLIIQAEEFVRVQTDNLNEFVAAYEEAQAKKRKKKLRIARLEKTDEELAFEADKGVLEMRRYNASSGLEAAKSRHKELRDLKKRFEASYSMGWSLIYKVQQATHELLDECRQEIQFLVQNGSYDPARPPDYRDCFHRKELAMHVEGVLGQYQQLGNFLREKGEKLGIIDALNSYGDLLLLFGRIAEARAVWHDTIDGFYSVMDACQEWRGVVRKVTDQCTADSGSRASRLVQSGVLYTVAVLGKLSKYTVPNDWDGKVGYCSMAAGLARVPFLFSCGHPQTLSGLGAYELRQLGGLVGVALTSEAFPVASFCLALEEAVAVLLTQSSAEKLTALPLVVLWEYMHAVHIRNPPAWLDARLQRIRLLVDLKMFTPAASMLAAIPSTLRAILDHTFINPLRSKNTLSSDAFDTAGNGYDFYGYPPYCQHLPPVGLENEAALGWIGAFPTEFKQLSARHTVALRPGKGDNKPGNSRPASPVARPPDPKSSPSQGGKEGAPAPAPVPLTPAPASATPTGRGALFQRRHEAAVACACTQFLLEVSRTDGRAHAPHSAGLAKTAEQAIELAREVVEMLAVMGESGESGGSGGSGEEIGGNSLAHTLLDPTWLGLYMRAQTLVVRGHIGQRRLREARVVLLGCVQLLTSPVMARMGAAGRREAVEGWFVTTDGLAEVAERQGRFGDAVGLATQGAKDASNLMCGYWVRAFLLRRGGMSLKLRQYPECETDCDAVLRQYDRSQCVDLGLVRALVLMATVQRQKTLQAPAGRAMEGLMRGLDNLRRATATADALARAGGFLGADCNVTYGRADTTVMEGEALPPLLHSLTDDHVNRAAITLRSQVNARRYLEVQGPGAVAAAAAAAKEIAKEKIRNREKPSEEEKSSSPKKKSSAKEEKYKVGNLGTICGYDYEGGDPGPRYLRRGPVDDSELPGSSLTPSEFASVYSDETRALLLASVALAVQLDDMRCALYAVLANAASAKAGNGRALSKEEEDHLAAERTQAVQELLDEQVVVAETALKVLRHCLYAPPAARTAALLYTGLARYADATPVHVDADEGPALPPLQAVLRVACDGPHPDWGVARSASVQLVDYFGGPAAPLGEESKDGLTGPHRLRAAVRFLLHAIKLGGQRYALTKGALALAEDPALASADKLPPALAALLVASSSSSTTTNIVTGGVEKAGDSLGGKGAKVSDVKGGKAANTLTGRDAMLLLSNMVRETGETDPLWMDGYEHDLCYDLHVSLRDLSPAYALRCAIPEPPVVLPAADGSYPPLSVPLGSLSALWVPVAVAHAAPDTHADTGTHGQGEGSAVLSTGTPPVQGLYTHLTGYLLLGAVQATGSTEAPSAATAKAPKGAPPPPAATSTTPLPDPVLTKVTLFKPDVVAFEEGVRYLRTELAVAGGHAPNPLTGVAALTPDALKSCAKRLGDLVGAYMNVLRKGRGLPDGKASKTELAQNGADDAALVVVIKLPALSSYPRPGSGSASRAGTAGTATSHEEEEEVFDDCPLPLTDATLASLAATFSCERDLEAHVDHSVCALLRVTLGFNNIA